MRRRKSIWFFSQLQQLRAHCGRWVGGSDGWWRPDRAGDASNIHLTVTSIMQHKDMSVWQLLWGMCPLFSFSGFQWPFLAREDNNPLNAREDNPLSAVLKQGWGRPVAAWQQSSSALCELQMPRGQSRMATPIPEGYCKSRSQALHILFSPESKF